MKMPTFDSGGVEISYEVEGEGEPILLIHGFASNARVNWYQPEWVKLLTGSGRRAILIDNRGHGKSEKLYDPAQYATEEMADDSMRLLDHLQIQKADVMGYSMGARLAALLAIRHPQRVRSAVLGGLAANLIRGVNGSEPIALALEADSASDVEDRNALTYRVFAEQTKSDLKALAACMRGGRQPVAVEELSKIVCPVLVVAGDADPVSGPVGPLVEAIPDAEGVTLKDRDHMKSVGDKTFKLSVLDFLDRRP